MKLYRSNLEYRREIREMEEQAAARGLAVPPAPTHPEKNHGPEAKQYRAALESHHAAMHKLLGTKPVEPSFPPLGKPAKAEAPAAAPATAAKPSAPPAKVSTAPAAAKPVSAAPVATAKPSAPNPSAEYCARLREHYQRLIAQGKLGEASAYYKKHGHLFRSSFITYRPGKTASK